MTKLTRLSKVEAGAELGNIFRLIYEVSASCLISARMRSAGFLFIYLFKTESNKKQKFSAWAQENHDDDEPRTLRLLSEPGNLHEDSSSDLRSSRILKTISKYSTKSLSSFISFPSLRGAKNGHHNMWLWLSNL